MFEKIKGIKIQSTIFETMSVLDLFDGEFVDSDNENDRVSLLFGRNGSGKSTLARGVNQIKSGLGDASYVSFVDKNGDELILNDDNKNAIFVFDENYIDSKVKISQDGLNAIVIFGEQNNIDEEISEIQKELVQCESEDKNLSLELDKIRNRNDEQSPEYWKNEIISSLKGTGNWAERDREIKNNRAATAITESIFKQIIDSNSTMDKAKLDNIFKDKMKEYTSLRDDGKNINNKLDMLRIELDFGNLSELLSKKIESAELTDRDKYLLELLSNSNRGERYLKEVKDYFSVEVNDRCPYCTQNISSSTRGELINGISKLLSREVEEHQKALRLVKIPPKKLDFAEYSQFNDLIKLCQSNLDSLNKKIDEINLKIEQKINNPYTPINLSITTFYHELSLVNSSISQINESVDRYNSAIANTNKLKEELISINNEIAYYEIKDYHKKYLEKVEYKKKLEEKSEKTKIKIGNLKIKINELYNKKISIDIAVDQINEGLRYIFLSKERLSLKSHSGKYFLLSRGKNIHPNKVSSGERNAIALIYFFTDIIQQKELANAYSQEYFLVIDDPISSFDLENKIGMISYLKFSLNKFLIGNKQTRALLTTHDVQTMYDFDKFLTEIMNKLKEKEGGMKSKYKRLELFNGKLREFKIRSHGYTELLEIVYEYATSTIDNDVTDKSEYFVGNAMRKILEAYGTFTYKKGIAELTTNASVIEKIEEKYRTYFENLMYRLLLHSESHYEDSVKAINIDFFSSFPNTARQKTARDLLVLLYLFDELHVLTHLSAKSNVKSKLEEWKNDIA